MLASKTLSAAMQHACAEARRWLGATSPNPPVGAAGLDAQGNILAITAHRCAGEPHAEALLIKQCREQGLISSLHTICVTMTPCNHHGKTPPCCDLIIESGVKNVVIGTPDPNILATRGSISRLNQAGIKITIGVEEELCRQLIYAFAVSIKTARPWITIKRAFDEHGSMIPPAGQKTFTSMPSLLLAHRLRKRADAILTGSGTVLADNPLFTVRRISDHPGKSRLLAILDRRRRVPFAYIDEARKRGFEPIVYDDICDALDNMASRGVHEVLVEAGPTLSSAMLKNGLWNMAVTIHKGIAGKNEQDRIDAYFNGKSEIPFHPQEWKWENVLPA